jgi:hypothetical protein
MLAGGVVAMLASLPIGALCFRLRGPYFAIATIATAQVLMLLFLKFRDFAWGAEGTTLPNLGNSPLMMQFDAKAAYYYIALVLLAVGLAITYRIERSWMGYYLVAVGEDEDAAEAIGVNALPDRSGRNVLRPIHLFHRSQYRVQLQRLGGGGSGVDRRRDRHLVGPGRRHRATGSDVCSAAKLAWRKPRRRAADGLQSDPDSRDPMAADWTARPIDGDVRTPGQC